MPLYFKAGEVFETARFLLNDTEDGGSEYTDAALVPPLKIALNDLRLECEDNNIPFTNITSKVITIPAGVKSIGDSSEAGSPPLPIDLIEIIEMYERWSGTNSDFTLMDRRRFLPKTEVLTSYLSVWTWQKQTVQFLGANGDIEVKMDYVGDSFVALVDANSKIALFNSINFLSFRTAALAANFIGENKTRSDELNVEAQRCIDSLENIGTKNQQSMPVRRRPFRARWKGEYGNFSGR